MQIEEIIPSEVYAKAKKHIVGKWVYLAKHPERSWERVKVKDADYHKRYVEIEFTDGKKEDVKFGQLCPIPKITESMLREFSKTIDEKKAYWNESNGKDIKITPDRKRCQWIYDNYRNWLTDPDWDIMAYGFNSDNPNFEKFLSDFLQLVDMSMMKNAKYHSENEAL